MADVFSRCLAGRCLPFCKSKRWSVWIAKWSFYNSIRVLIVFALRISVPLFKLSILAREFNVSQIRRESAATLASDKHEKKNRIFRFYSGILREALEIPLTYNSPSIPVPTWVLIHGAKINISIMFYLLWKKEIHIFAKTPRTSKYLPALTFPAW